MAAETCGTIDLYLYNNRTRGTAPVPIVTNILNDVSSTYSWASSSEYCGGEWKIRVYCTITYSAYTASFTIAENPTAMPTQNPTVREPTRIPSSIPTSEPTAMPSSENENDDIIGIDASNSLSVAGINGLYVGSVYIFLFILCCMCSFLRLRRYSRKHREELNMLGSANEYLSSDRSFEMIESNPEDGKFSPTERKFSRRVAAEAAGHFGAHLERTAAQISQKPTHKPTKPPKPAYLSTSSLDGDKKKQRYEENGDDYYDSDSEGDVTVSTDKDFSHWSREEDFDVSPREGEGPSRYQQNPLRSNRRERNTNRRH